MGVYVSGHPLDGYADKFKDCTFNTSFLQNTEEDEDGNEVFTDVKNDMQVYLGGIITGVTKINTKSGSTMNFVTVEDRYGAIECVFFPKKYEKYQTLLHEEQLIKIKGRLQIRDDNKVSVSVDFAEGVSEEQTAEAKPQEKQQREFLGIILDENTEHLKDELIDVLATYPGEITVYFKINGKNYKMDKKVRNCRGLVNELMSIVDEDKIKFFKA